LKEKAMEKERSIIQVIQSADPVVNAHLDSLNEGDSPWKEPATYRNVETGEAYLYLAGGIGWPWKDVPGFVAAVAVGKMPGEEVDVPLFTCLEELEDDRIEGLLEGCLRLRDRYGFRQSDSLFRTWYGDSKSFATLVNQFNLKLMKEEKKVYGVYPTDPFDFQQPNHFELYKRRIQSLLMRTEAGSKSLILGTCTALRNYLQNLPPDTEDCPAVTALGGVVYSLMVHTPWTVRTQIPEPTISDIDAFEKETRCYYQNNIPWERQW
jgi:hypothetical protein